MLEKIERYITTEQRTYNRGTRPAEDMVFSDRKHHASHLLNEDASAGPDTSISTAPGRDGHSTAGGRFYYQVPKSVIAEILGWPSVQDDEDPHWSGGELQGSVLNKVWKTVTQGLVKCTVHGYTILPREGYNKTPRHLTFDLQCDCQGYAVRGHCSHQLMVRVWRKLLEMDGRGLRFINKDTVLVNMGGDNHLIQRVNGKWTCSCDYYYYHKECKHLKEFFALMKHQTFPPLEAYDDNVGR